MTAKDDSQKAQASSRADFMKRLFAVAVSVGFASPLTRMVWIEKGTLPTDVEWHQIAILATALLATIGSWEGYFSAIDNRPLKGVIRFVIDIILVLIYMILLISSAHPNFFLPILVFIFLLYVIWDALTIYEYKDYYYYGTGTESPINCVVLTTYRRGVFSLRTEGAVRRGHIVTVLWAAYFIGLLIMQLRFAVDNVYLVCGMASLGLLAYRIAKATKYDSDGNEKRKSGCTIALIAFAVIGLLAVDGLIGHYLRI